MTYSASRQDIQDLGHVFHYFVGSRQAAEAAAAKANEAQREYEQKLTALMDKLGIPRDQINYVKVNWFSDQVTVQDPFGVPMPQSDGTGVHA